MPAKMTKTDEGLELSLANCRGGEFTDTLAKIKEIPGRRYDGQRKLWLVPAEPAVGERVLLALNPEVDPEVVAWIRGARQEVEADLVTPLPDDGKLMIPWSTERAPWQPQEINGEPFTGLKAHQRALVSYIADNKITSAIIADDMGLGKTIEVISITAEVAIRQAAELVGPKLVVCPKSVMGVWKRELERWLGPDEPAVICAGSNAQARENQLTGAIFEGSWAIVNYEQLRVVKEKVKTRNGGEKVVTRMKQPLFETTPWAVVIADEAHRAKNRKAAQTRGLFRTRGSLMYAATGTPLMNSPDELWALLHWLFPDEYTSYWRFFETYVDYTEGYHGRVITGVKNPDALRFELNGRLFRRTKDQVLDLPEKQRIIVPIELGVKQRKLYDEAERNIWLEVEKAVQDKTDPTAAALVEAAAAGNNIYSIPNGAARTVRLRQILSSPRLLGGDDDSAKLDSVCDRITDNRHKPHVVFTEFVETCNIVQERLATEGIVASIYTGETTGADRTQIEDDFQAGNIDVVIGTIGAMREGITLTAADTVHFIERAWVPGWNEQAEDRCHRIGQRNSVTIYIYEGQDTVDDGRVMPTNRKKERIVSTVLPKDSVKES